MKPSGLTHTTADGSPLSEESLYILHNRIKLRCILVNQDRIFCKLRGVLRLLILSISVQVVIATILYLALRG